MHVQNLMNSLWDIRVFLSVVPKESPCIKWHCNLCVGTPATNYRVRVWVTYKVLVELPTLLLRIRKDAFSNVGRDTGHHVWGISWWSSDPPGKFRDNSWHYTTTASFHVISNLIFANCPTVRHHIIWATQSVIKLPKFYEHFFYQKNLRQNC